MCLYQRQHFKQLIEGAKTTRKKQKSKQLGKFLIYIQEDENGHVWIQSDSVGDMGKAFDLGLVGLIQFVPAVVLTLLVGHVADRYDRRAVLGENAIRVLGLTL